MIPSTSIIHSRLNEQKKIEKCYQIFLKCKNIETREKCYLKFINCRKTVNKLKST